MGNELLPRVTNRKVPESNVGSSGMGSIRRGLYRLKNVGSPVTWRENKDFT